MRQILFILICVCYTGANAQEVESIFSAPAEVCLNQNISLLNQSQNATRYEWDVCQGDLSLMPSAAIARVVSGNVTSAIEIEFDGANWFGFVTSRETNSIKRLSFGNNLNAVPVIDELSISEEIFPWRPIDIDVVYEAGEWFAFVYGESINMITRIDIGPSLAATSILHAEIILTGDGNGNCGLSVVRNLDSYYIAYTNTFSFGTIFLPTIRSTPTMSERMHTGNIPGILNFGDVKLIKDQAEWYAFLPAYGSQKLFRAKLGLNPLSTPIIEDISGVLIGGLSPYGIDIGIDQNQYFAFACTVEGALIRINLGEDLSAQPISITSLGNLSVLAATLKFKLVKFKSTWFGFTITWNGGEVIRINFPVSSCVEYPTIIETLEPIVEFQNTGSKYITLRAFSGASSAESHSKINVNASIAPEISIENSGMCVSVPIQFTAQSNQAVQSAEWLFGDSTGEASLNPVHAYSLTGTYNVSLRITGSNGCANSIMKPVKIYSSPIASFETPSGIICTNNEYLFTNATTDNYDSNLNYHWFVNGVLKTNTRDFNHTLESIGNQEIKLVASIPGCSNESVQNLMNVLEGPMVDFSFSGRCEQTPVAFTNLSSGAITSYNWTFDANQVSSELNPLHTFSNSGQFEVSLTAANALGCLNKRTKILPIYTKPTANFSLALPPFSCSGSASQFTDLTPAPTDSNISSWNWTFGDTQNNTAAIKNPSHMYATSGDYSVSLNVATNFGCTSEITKTVTIAQTPNIDFTNTALCLNQPATFTPTATTEIKAWLWGMQNLTYTAQSPVHAFTTSGNQTVTMAATGNNNCVKSVTKNLSVPVPVTINFSANSTCAGKPAEFTETSLTGLDPAVSWSWDFAGQASATTSSATHIFPATGNFNVRLNSTRQSGCTYSSTRSIAISQAPVSQFSVSTESGGAPLAVGFVNTSSGATSWLWNFNDADQTTSTEFSPAFTYNQLGTYQAELIARNNLGCTDSFVKSIFVVEPQINVAVTNLLLIANNDGALATVTFENRSNVVVVNPEIILDLAGKAKIKERVFGTFLPGQQSSKSISTRIVSDNLGYICAEISVAGDVNSFDNRACSNLTGELTVVPPYPNPASEEVILEWIRGQRNQVEVKLYNVQGQVVLNKVHTNLSAGLNQLLIKVDALLPGLYFAKVSDGDNTASYRVQVNR